MEQTNEANETNYGFVEYNEKVAMQNAYMIITKKCSIDTIMDLNPETINFPFVPIDYSNKDIQIVIEYYAAKDMFEKCIELQKELKNGKHIK